MLASEERKSFGQKDSRLTQWLECLTQGPNILKSSPGHADDRLIA